MSQVAYKLTIVEGPLSGQEFELIENSYILGREDGADIVIPAQSVSREHARISFQEGSYIIEDLDSSNGSFINGNRLDSLPVPINHGDEIILGQSVTLVFKSPVKTDQVAETRVAISGASQVAQTVMSDEPLDHNFDTEPPELVVEIVGQTPYTCSLTREVITIGRFDDNDIVIPSKVVSRQHAHLERVGQGYRITILPGNAVQPFQPGHGSRR